jgi:predicted Zn finger-like uncharacterized protein
METQSAAWVGQVLADRYQVTAELGAGGMAVVYRAHDLRLGGEVVLKVPRPALLQDPLFAGRFTHEVRAVVQLSHPHVVKVLDFGDFAGHPFAVMQFLPGGSLRDRQKNGDVLVPRPPADLAGWLPAVAQALDFMHRRGFVHRDVKPDNILFDSDGNAYLGDFGIAKALSDERPKEHRTAATGTGMILGTAAYMAPEVILGEPYDGRADQYGLAVTVFELVSGQLPYEGGTMAAIAVQQATKAAPQLDQILTGLPAGLSAAVHRAMTPEPKQRFSDCPAFAAAVTEAVREGPAPIRAQVIVSPTETSRTGACPSCGTDFQMPVGAAGRRVKCRACGAVFRAPGVVAQGGTAVAVRTSPARVPPAPAVETKVGSTAVAPVPPRLKEPAPRSRPSPERPQRLNPGLVVGVAVAGMVAVALVGIAAWLVATVLVHDKAHTGTLVLEDVPNGALVFVDGQRMDVPLPVPQNSVRLELPEGRHEVQVTKNGFAVFTKEVTLQAGQDEPIQIALQPMGLAQQPPPRNMPPPPIRPVLPPGVPPQGPPQSSAPPHVVVLQLQLVDPVVLNPGQGRTVTIRVIRKNWEGPVDLRLDGLPAGEQLRRAVVPAGSEQGNLDLAADQDVLPGDRMVRVRAAAGGTETTATFRLSVVRSLVRVEPMTNSLGMRFVRVPRGTFWAGGGNGRPGTRQVTIAQDFYLGAYEVTHDDWRAVMGPRSNPSHFARTGAGKAAVQGVPDKELRQFPVENVSWEQVQEFLRQLNAREKNTDWLYRLPTALEWEYACRGAGTSKEECASDFYLAEPTNRLASEQANFNGGIPAGRGPKRMAGNRPCRVGSYPPNRLGLYDMHGNVYEWCEDGPAGDRLRTCRGGSWNSFDSQCRAGGGESNPATDRAPNLGFRVARVRTAGLAPEQRPPDATSPPAGDQRILANAIGMDLVLIPAGDFYMGSNRKGDIAASEDETPRHAVKIPRTFRLAVTKTTQGQFEQVLGRDPSTYTGGTNPVERVTYFDAVEFCNKLSEKEGRTPCYRLAGISREKDGSIVKADVEPIPDGSGYRLPSEAEWEYCARAGTTTRFWYGESMQQLYDHAWFDTNSRRPSSVAQKKANPWGLYDMGGLLAEWCDDVWHENYEKAPVDGSAWRLGGDQGLRVVRGGSWRSSGASCRCAARSHSKLGNQFGICGFRVVLVGP